MGEVHQIAYLTMKGWTLVGTLWLKDGFEFSFEKRRECGCCVKQETTPYFELDAAYSAQWERDNES
jgi:hypothetical protein